MKRLCLSPTLLPLELLLLVMIFLTFIALEFSIVLHIHNFGFYLAISCLADMPKPPGEDTCILPDEYNYMLRSKRSVLKGYKNKEMNVETLVVADRKMLQNHGHDNITTYVLTILNMVR